MSHRSLIRQGWNRRKILNSLCSGLCLAAGVRAIPSSAQEARKDKYPTRPVDYIAPSGPGSGVDQLARVTSPLIEKELRVPFPVLNVQGAVGAAAVAKLLASRADGQTIGLYVASMNALVAAGRSSWKLSDLAPIARLQKIPSFLFVKQDSPYADYDQLEKAVKAKPNELKTAVLGKGSLDDVALTVMARRDFKTTIVPFTSPGERYSSILGNHADILYEQAGDVAQFLSTKKMRPVLVFNETRLDEFKDVPTSREKGYEIFLPEFRGVVAKAETPEWIVQILSEAFGNIFKTPEMLKFSKEQFVSSDSYQPAAQFTRFLEQENVTLAKYFKEYEIR